MHDENQLSSDIATLKDSAAALRARVQAAGRLAASDDRRAWAALLRLCNDHEVSAQLATAAGAALARIAFRIRESGARILGEDENSLLRDFSRPAYHSYDATTAELQRRT